MVVFRISRQPASGASGLHLSVSSASQIYFFKGIRWLVSKQLLRMGAIAIDGCEAGRTDTEGLWQSQHTHLIRNCRDAKAALLSQ